MAQAGSGKHVCVCARCSEQWNPNSELRISSESRSTLKNVTFMETVYRPGRAAARLARAAAGAALWVASACVLAVQNSKNSKQQTATVTAVRNCTSSLLTRPTDVNSKVCTYLVLRYLVQLYRASPTWYVLFAVFAVCCFRSFNSARTRRGRRAGGGRTEDRKISNKINATARGDIALLGRAPARWRA